jgi:hypothetical protein
VIIYRAIDCVAIIAVVQRYRNTRRTSLLHTPVDYFTNKTNLLATAINYCKPVAQIGNCSVMTCLMTARQAAAGICSEIYSKGVIHEV